MKNCPFSKKRLSFMFSFVFVAIFFFSSFPLNAYMVKYKEDWYRLYHVHYAQFPDDCIENIYWLEKAARADFSNPLHALSKIEDEKQWEKYRYLFQMHLNLKLVEQHMRLGRIYDKKVAYFYDAPYKDAYLENLEKALTCYNTALVYWQEALSWAEKANVHSFFFTNLSSLQYWEDERERIRLGELDYKKTLHREIKRVEKVRDVFLGMEGYGY